MANGDTTFAFHVSHDLLDKYNLSCKGHLLVDKDVHTQLRNLLIQIVDHALDKSPKGIHIRQLTTNGNNTNQNITTTNNKIKEDKTPLRVTAAKSDHFSEPSEAYTDESSAEISQPSEADEVV